MPKIIKYTINPTVDGAYIKIDEDGNSGNNLVLPTLDGEVLKHIVNDNNLVVSVETETKNNIEITIYKSKKYRETLVKHTKSLKTGECRLYFIGRLFVSSFISLDIPKGYDFDIRNRSGNFKRNINVIMGLIDNPYTGNMGLQISTYGNFYTEIEFETSISQIVLHKVYNKRFNFVHNSVFRTLKSVLKKQNKRGDKGFGSTGKK